MKRKALYLLSLLALVSCAKEDAVPTPPSETPAPPSSIQAQDPYAADRAYMVTHDLAARGIKDEQVLKAMGTVPREAFVLGAFKAEAYQDSPLPIKAGQTISQPYIVAAMTEALQVRPDHVVLEIGTGSGYQAAVLAGLAKHVYTIEIVEELAASASEVLKALTITNVTVKAGDGYKGWPAHAPFDGVIVTAAPDHVPQPLVDQLKPGGRMVIPVGPQHAIQHLLLIEKDAEGKVTQREMMPVRFVPFTGEGAPKIR